MHTGRGEGYLTEEDGNGSLKREGREAFSNFFFLPEGLEKKNNLCVKDQMDCVQWCLCPAKWKSTEKEATAGMGESFTCKKSPYFSLLLPLCRKKTDPN